MKLWESMGGSVLGMYMTMGDFDFVAIGEGPDDQAAAAFALALGARRARSVRRRSRHSTWSRPSRSSRRCRRPPP